MNLPCNHYFVDGFGGMGDAVVCKLCGLDRYPEAIQASLSLAKLQGRYIEDDGSVLYLAAVREAQAARVRREQRE